MRFSFCKSLFSVLSSAAILMFTGCGGGGGGDFEPNPLPINNLPTVSIVQPASNPCLVDVRTATYMDCTIRVDDPDGETLTCHWTWDAGSVSPEETTVKAGQTITIRYTPPKQDGTYTIGVAVRDKEASTYKSFKVQVIGNETVVPTDWSITDIRQAPDPTSPEATASLSAIINNPSGKTLTYTWRSKFGEISGGGSTATWTAPSESGIYCVYLNVSDGTTTLTAGKALNVAGTTGGVLGQYFKTDRYKGTVRLIELRMTRTDPNINFTWEKLSPDPGNIPREGWGARWTGFVKCEDPGTYTFRIHVDDGARMRVKNDAGEWIGVVPDTKENWSDHTEGAWLPYEVVPLQLNGGKWYPIEVEFFQGGVDAFVHLYWSVNDGPEVIVPQEALKPPS